MCLTHHCIIIGSPLIPSVLLRILITSCFHHMSFHRLLLSVIVLPHCTYTSSTPTYRSLCDAEAETTIHSKIKKQTLLIDFITKKVSSLSLSLFSNKNSLDCYIELIIIYYKYRLQCLFSPFYLILLE